MIVIWFALAVGGLGLTAVASERAVDFASPLAHGSRIPPFIVGMTLLALGTDLPEIANSIAASASDHGDINVGDSIGSAATQATLILGLLPLIGRSMPTDDKGFTATGWAAVAGLLVVAVVVADDHLGRWDALALITLWVVGSRLVYRQAVTQAQLDLPTKTENRISLAAKTLAALLVVAGGAIMALTGIVRIAEEFGVPEFLISFFALSVGTSLPELIFDLTAIRRGEVAMAAGNILGACFIDATLSISAGPLLFPTEISGSRATEAAVAAAAAIAIVTLIFTRVPVHDRRTGVILLILYAALYAVLI